MPNIKDLATFRSTITDIARPYLFSIDSASAGAKLDEAIIGATLRTASLPGVDFAPVPVSYFGLDLKFNGPPTFSDLSCSIMIDDKYDSLKEVQKLLAVGHTVTTEGELTLLKPDAYMGTLKISGLNGEKSAAHSYELQNAFLHNVQDVALDQSNKTGTLTFTCQIAYSHYKV